MAATVIQGPSSIQVDEDTLTALQGFSVSDADNTTLTTVIVRVTHGTLELDPAFASLATFNPSHRLLEFHSKAISDINAALATLKYLPDADYSGPDRVLVAIQADALSSGVHSWYSVDVRAVNDPPVLTPGGGFTTLDVVEGTTAITKVVASDADGDRITYRIAGGPDADKVEIDPKTGKLTFIDAPDFSKPKDADGDNFYQFRVEASDGSASVREPFIVAVTKSLVNKAPVITSDGGGANAALSVAENTIVVTQVLAQEPNGDTKLKFSIAGGADAGKFAIDGKTGALSFVSPPDYETPTDAGTDNVYDVVVKVSDGKLDTIQTMAVTVTDVEEAPVITSDGGGDSALIHHSEDVVAVTTVIATDSDAGDTITYAILGGADAAEFAIDPNTGVLSFIAPPAHGSPTDANGDNVYQVIVAASDGQELDEQTLTIDVDDAAGVLILGTTGRDKVNASQTVDGQLGPTEHGDLIFGFRHKDKLRGLDGDDALFGGVGRDKLNGGQGSDVLVGGQGNNVLKGGGGSDFFVFDWTLQKDRFSTIKDFKPGEDVLALDHDHFAGLGAGDLPDGMLRIGAKAKDADDRIIYNDKTGKVSFDVDGKGGAGAIHFATIDKKLDLQADDILLV
jgi:Ca2+-binding RTX toxin-like protein